jgi:hypothetical protein
LGESREERKKGQIPGGGRESVCVCVLLLFEILRLGFRSRVLDRVTDLQEGGYVKEAERRIRDLAEERKKAGKNLGCVVVVVVVEVLQWLRSNIPRQV